MKPSYSYRESSQSECHRSSNGTLPSVTASPHVAGQESDSPRQSSRTGGLNTNTVVGALLGAAAGAALTYGFVSSSKSSSHRHEQEPQLGASLPRRATYPEKPVMSQDYPSPHENGKAPMEDYNTPRKLTHTNFRPPPLRGAQYTNSVEDVDYGKGPSPPTRYLGKDGPNQNASRSRALSRARCVDYSHGSRNGRAAETSGNCTIRGRARSETPRERVPLVPYDDWDGQSLAHTRRNAAPESVVSHPPLSRSNRPHYEPGRESYVSARTHRSATTTRRLDNDHRHPRHETTSRSRSSSHISAATAREAPGALSGRAASRASATRVPLPMSGMGSSHADWNPWDVPLPMSRVGSSYANWDDDMVSLAPSDSISCAGSKGGRRSRKHRP